MSHALLMLDLGRALFHSPDHVRAGDLFLPALLCGETQSSLNFSTLCPVGTPGQRFPKGSEASIRSSR